MCCEPLKVQIRKQDATEKDRKVESLKEALSLI